MADVEMKDSAQEQAKDKEETKKEEKEPQDPFYGNFDEFFCKSNVFVF